MIHTFKITVIKNGVSQFTVIHNASTLEEINDRLWEYFSNGGYFRWGDLMVHNPDFAKVEQLPGDVEKGQNKKMA